MKMRHYNVYIPDRGQLGEIDIEGDHIQTVLRDSYIDDGVEAIYVDTFDSEELT